LLKRRISSPRAATVVVLAAVVAVSATVAPSLAQSFLTNQKAAKVFVSNKRVNSLSLKKKTAANLYVARVDAPKQPVIGIAAGTAQFGPVSATTAGYIPTAFTSFATKANVSSAVITFSGTVSCTLPGKTPTVDQACPVQILVDGTSTGKVNFAPATAEGTTAKPAAALVHTISQTTVLGKGGHTIAIQYAGANALNFQLKSWNLSVQAYPQPEEVEEEATTPKKSSGSGGKS